VDGPQGCPIGGHRPAGRPDAYIHASTTPGGDGDAQCRANADLYDASDANARAPSARYVDAHTHGHTLVPSRTHSHAHPLAYCHIGKHSYADAYPF
jgi:hypothetical protein